MRKTPVFSGFFLVLLLLVAGANACLLPRRGKEPEGVLSQPANLCLEIRTDRRVYTAGDPVALSFLLLNTSPTMEARLTFNTGQIFDLVLSQNGQAVWRWSADKLFTQAVQEKTLAPQEFIFKVLLLSPETTAPLAAGEYELEVMITAVQLRGYSKSVPLQFREK
ncbi:MAG: hypothetical protein GX085_03025 [Firmicutes bacterium]|nr:hypothetical protein [Bacillota bacterium]